MAVALYARVSTSRQAEADLSIPDQLNQMRAWCDRHGHVIAKEYVEPGASATDDRRPVLQQMMADALLSPPPFESIIIHSLSRFFRDSIQFGLYERRLKKAGVRIISISQQTSDDPAGEMARQIFSLFDEYSSKENAKHTLRSMKENARQGFFNGAKPPFGFRLKETDQVGNRGRKKKRLTVEENEAAVVRQIYDLYLQGHRGQIMGMKAIADYLNSRGIRMRGRRWRNQKVQKILSDTVYRGQGVFNTYDVRNQKPKPESEWVYFEVEPIIDPELFDQVKRLRENRQPTQGPPKIVSSQTLLTGLLKCGHCGCSMALATGKSGRYQYYKCTTKLSKATHLCPTPNLPRAKTDRLVLERLADRVFTVPRVTAMLNALRRRLKEHRTKDDQRLQEVQLALTTTETGLQRLYEAVEQGILPLDQTLSARVEALKRQRETLLAEMAGLRQQRRMPLDSLTPAKITAFIQVLRDRLLDPNSGFGKRYLQLLVSEIRVTGTMIELKGDVETLAEALVSTMDGGDPECLGKQVPRFISIWRPQGDSNPCYRRERAVS